MSISGTKLDHLLTNSRESLSFDQIFCQLENPSNLSGHDAIMGTFKFNHVNQANDSTDYAHTYEDFNPKRVLWKENEMYENLTYDVLSKLLNCFDQPEHLPCLAEMFSNMIVMCAEKCYQSVEKKKFKYRPQPFSPQLRQAYQTHAHICKEWRKQGRPQSATHPAKVNKLESQRYLQKLQRAEYVYKSKKQHDELMSTYSENISMVCRKLKQISGDKSKSLDIEEINTLNGIFKGVNVLEGFRSNTEIMCNYSDNATSSNDYLNNAWKT